MWKFRRRGGEVTPKEKIFKYLKRVDPGFQKIIFETIDVYPELKKSFYSDNDEFFERIRIEHDLTNSEQVQFVKKVLEKYAKLQRKKQVNLVDEDLLNLDKVKEKFPEINNLLDEKAKILKSDNERY